MNQIPVYYPVYLLPEPYMMPYNIQSPEMFYKINYLIKENESLQNSINNINRNIDSLVEINKSLIDKVNIIEDKCFKIEDKIKEIHINKENKINIEKKNNINTK